LHGGSRQAQRPRPQRDDAGRDGSPVGRSQGVRTVALAAMTDNLQQDEQPFRNPSAPEPDKPTGGHPIAAVVGGILALWLILWIVIPNPKDQPIDPKTGETKTTPGMTTGTPSAPHVTSRTVAVLRAYTAVAVLVPPDTTADTMLSICTRLSTRSAGRLATPTKTAARTPLTIKNSSDMKGAFLVALLFLTLAAESSTSTLIYVSDYFSFVGADQHGRVAFALDNNRGRDGEAFQAEHFVVLHDEQDGWMDVAGNGPYDNPKKELARIPDSPFFQFTSATEAGLTLT